MKSRVSEWMDGELDRHEADAMLAAVRAEGEAREAWRTYHLISDTLHGARMLSPGFATRVATRLAEEPTVLAPTLPLAPRRARWLALPAAASVAAMALVGWLAFGPWLVQETSVPVAQAPPAIPVAKTKQPVRVPPPAAADDYLLAHQRYSPRNSLQGMAPYVRTVSGEAGARRP